VKAGKPADKDGYTAVEVDGMNFYVKDELAGREITIGWTGWWVFGGPVVSVT
jgi:hypothetical protein